MYEDVEASVRAGERAEVRLEEIVTVLDAAVREVVRSPSARNPPVSTVALVDASDLTPQLRSAPQADIVLPVGIRGELATTWLRGLADQPLAQRPVAVLVKESIDSPGIRDAAEAAAVALVFIDDRARWDTMLAAVYRRLDRQQPSGTGLPDAGAASALGELSELASVIADGTGGMVTIERMDSLLLAYSPSDGTADELRARAILGREAPLDSMRILAEWGVIDSIRRTRDVVSVPEHQGLGMRPRLVTGIHGPTGRFLGSIWVQRGAQPFSPEAETVMRGGAAAAAQILWRELEAPSAEEVALRRLFGEGGGIEAGTAAALLRVTELGDAAVIGIALASANETVGGTIRAVAKLLRLHISAFAPQALFLVEHERVYALLPHLQSTHLLQEWAEQLIARFDTLTSTRDHPLRLAFVSPITSLAQVAEARAEADRVLDAAREDDARVTSLKQSLSAVLLHEALTVIGAHPELADPRLVQLEHHDDHHGADLMLSLRAYVDAGFNAREAARCLDVHPNTLRYRIGRAQELAGLDLSRAQDRLVLSLQLALRERARRPG